MERLWADRQKAVELYLQGYGAKRISHVIGVDSATIRHWLKRYRQGGLEALRPYRRNPPEEMLAARQELFRNREAAFSDALAVYASTLEPTLSIARRFGLDYRAFRYHIQHYHPDLVAHRNLLKTLPSLHSAT
ncbi:MAG: helix-turn-helix domain-containing protein [Bacteroidales bacterium]|nr:helix-turn-helix domain-containing protein [Bacteroidales bacterium]